MSMVPLDADDSDWAWQTPSAHIVPVPPGDGDALWLRVRRAVRVVERFGSTDGAHHKQWLLDQVLRVLLDDGYPFWRKRFDAESRALDYEAWDEGTPP